MPAVDNPHARNTYRVLNEPFKFAGILDWRYAAAAAVPAATVGLLSHSKLAGIAVFALLAMHAYVIAEEDPLSPLAWWVTLWDQKYRTAFGRGGRR